MSDTNTTRPETEESVLDLCAAYEPIRAPLDESLMMATGIVVAYLGNNHVPISELPGLIRTVYATVRDLGEGAGDKPSASSEPLVPAVAIKKSITPDFLVCLEDGKQFKSLKRHLRTRYDLTPDQYRARWSLPSDYPMVAPNYAAARSDLAKAMGLGQQRRKADSAEPMQAAA